MLIPNKLQEDLNIQHASSTRPKFLADFVGQKRVKESLFVFIEAAKKRGKPLDHVLFQGPPGLGKTTLAQVIASELGVSIKISSGPVLSKSGDLAAILTNLKDGDVLFIDEIHRLPVHVVEILYPAMEDYSIDIIIGSGPSARTVKIDLPKFTLIGATTKPGTLTKPLRDRFGIPIKLSFYECDELEKVIERNAQLIGMSIEDQAKELIARCSRGTPRIAIRLLRRVTDFTQIKSITHITKNIAKDALNSIDVDELGLDSLDRAYLKYISMHYAGGPVGVDTIAAGLSEDKDTIEDTIEPHLMHIGFVARTSRGRVLTKQCMDYITQCLILEKS